ncbi:MAG: thiamine biosynthesis protein [Frankiales bacterium]|nr:thiamine biosynthesis protein [Frankiales bacterium]
MQTEPMSTRGESQAVAAREQGLLSATWRALGTNVQLVVTDHLEQARVAIEQVLADIDLAASRFRDDSELSRLRPDTWTEVSPLFARALTVARDAAQWTDGLVDPTVGQSMRDLGYDRTFRLVTRDGPAVTIVRQPGGWDRIAVDGHRVTAPYGLDLGATAKGLAADMSAEAAGEHSAAVLVSLGGDIATAGEHAWPVLVTDTADPDETDQSGEVVTLYGGALATSGTRARRWTRGGRLVHHLLDPRTSMPADGPWQTASVLAETCVLANVASTAAIVSGEGAVTWLAARGFSARLVAGDGTVVHVGDWPKQERS